MLRAGISLTRRRQFRVLQREGHEAAAETLVAAEAMDPETRGRGKRATGDTR